MRVRWHIWLSLKQHCYNEGFFTIAQWGRSDWETDSRWPRLSHKAQVGPSLTLSPLECRAYTQVGQMMSWFLLIKHPSRGSTVNPGSATWLLSVFWTFWSSPLKLKPTGSSRWILWHAKSQLREEIFLRPMAGKERVNFHLSTPHGPHTVHYRWKT